MDELTTEEINNRKKWLKRYKKNTQLIDRLEEKLATLDERLYSIKSPIITDMPRGGIPISKEDLIADKDELQKRINRLNKRGREYKREILDKIDDLDDARLADITEAFFIDGKTFEEIARSKGYTVRHIIRLYGEAISAMSF